MLSMLMFGYYGGGDRIVYIFCGTAGFVVECCVCVLCVFGGVGGGGVVCVHGVVSGVGVYGVCVVGCGTVLLFAYDALCYNAHVVVLVILIMVWRIADDGCVSCVG